MKNKKEGTTLTCNRCQYTWQYKGKNPYYASCARCKTSIKIKK